MPSEILTVTTQDGPEASVILRAAGEIDRDSRDDLRQVAGGAMSKGVHRLVLDVGAVTFCDSSGLSLFVDLHRQTRGEGGWLRLAAVPPYLREMLRVTRLDDLLEIV